jgi:putative serine protease PepD
MTEEQGRAARPAQPSEAEQAPDAPWWSRPSGQVWDPPAYPQTQAPAYPGAAAVPGYPPAPAYPAAAVPGTPTAPLPAPPARSPWDAPGADEGADTLGRPERSRRGPGAGLLAALAVVLALVAGGTGGAAGYLLARGQDDSVTLDGGSLGAPPARSQQRPADSVAGVAGRVLPSVVQIKVVTAQGGGTGSGFVIDPDGLVVTNNHVVAGANGSQISVTFSDNRTVPARLVGRSGSYDLAVLKVSARNLKALPLGNSDSVVVGDPVIAVGSPLGLSGTVTSGIVSAKDRPVTAGARGGDDSSYINAIQTDAAINPGNSGGPLVDLDGEVIGVNSAIATIGATLGGESGNIGVGFAIPINQARRTAEQIIKTGEAQFPIIGASLDGTYEGPGARISPSAAPDGTEPVRPGGPADKAGLRPGDVITAIDGKRFEGSRELIVAIRSKRPGDTVTLTVRRSGRDRQVEVTLGASSG